VIAGSNDSRAALVTPPDQTPAAWQNATNVALHARPRLNVIGTYKKMAPATRPHGGLSPGALRRVPEYVETHLSESTDLATLAAVAGLSMHHFAREFKQSAGVPRTIISRRNGSNERRTCWLIRISPCRRLHLPWGFLTRVT
jgi:hypothetical protein